MIGFAYLSFVRVFAWGTCGDASLYPCHQTAPFLQDALRHAMQHCPSLAKFLLVFKLCKSSTDLNPRHGRNMAHYTVVQQHYLGSSAWRNNLAFLPHGVLNAFFFGNYFLLLYLVCHFTALRGNVCPARARRATFLLTIPTSAPDLPSHGEAPQVDHIALHTFPTKHVAK